MGDAFMGGQAPSLFLKLEYFREIFFLAKILLEMLKQTYYASFKTSSSQI
jgi:hypothetical protein